MRRKIFGMICVPLDRNAKARLLHRARCLMRATEKGRHYRAVTAKAYAIFAALLMGNRAIPWRRWTSASCTGMAKGCSKTLF
jgi:hypothetical protein